MPADAHKYEPADEPLAPERVPFWKRRHGSRAPFAGRLARRLSGLEFELRLDGKACRRGERVKGTLTLNMHRGRGKTVEVGLVCTESYDIATTTFVNNQTQQSRTTKRATAHEQWHPLEASAGEQAISFTVPETAPFTYHGKALSFDWQIRAVRRAAFRPDAAQHWEVEVLP